MRALALAALVLWTWMPPARSLAADESLVLLLYNQRAECALALVEHGRIRDAEDQDAVRLAHTAWLVQIGLVRREPANSAPASLVQDECEGDSVLDLGTTVTAAGYGLAYGGPAPKAVPLGVGSQGNSLDYAALLDLLTRDLGLPAGTPLAIQRVVEANLDADPLPERLIEAQWFGITGTGDDRLLGSGYDLLILRDPGQPPARLIGGAWRDSAELDAAFFQYHVPVALQGLADLDGDGLPELLLVAEGQGQVLTRQAGESYRPVAQCFLRLPC